MRHNFYLSPLAACLAMAMVSSVEAAEAVSLPEASFQTIRAQFQFDLPGVKQARALSGDSLQFVRQHTDLNKVSHVRMQQYYAGFQVYGGYAIMHSGHTAKSLAAAQNGVTMNGNVYRGLEQELGAPADDFVQNGQKALVEFKKQYAGQEVSQEQVTPMIFIDADNKAHWAYKVSVYIRHEHTIPERPTAIIDAGNGKTYAKWNNIKTEVEAVSGRGYGGNRKAGKVNYGKDFPLLEITRENNQCYMQNDSVKVVDMKHRTSSDNKPMTFKCKPSKKTPGLFWTGYKADGYDKQNGAYSPSNDAMYIGYVIKHMYKDWYNLEPLTNYDGSPMQLVMRVHYGEGYENAFWDGTQMTYGDGEDFMYPLVSLGVGAHEISHGFTEQHSDLAYWAQSGGMNESFSDMAAMAGEYYSVGESSWLIGAEIMKENSGYDALRYMDVPSRDGSSIDTAADYTDDLDVHYTSGVFNRLFYLMSTQEGWNPRKAFDVMVKANMDYWTPYSTFVQGGCGVLSAAKDLNYDTDGIKSSLKKVGIKYSSCGSAK
ncbi:zinc metalloprotease ProA [Legionella dresdenensis]|uniref:Neutral metalloproteinase n=1 Tax=Legionella dresdenensis TaxID=450200 RepID=A0ABV8CEQ1_9GAMM